MQSLSAYSLEARDLDVLSARIESGYQNYDTKHAKNATTASLSVAELTN